MLDWVFIRMESKNKFQLLNTLQIFNEMLLVKDNDINYYLEGHIWGIISLLDHPVCRNKALIFSQILNIVKTVYKMQITNLIERIENRE